MVIMFLEVPLQLLPGLNMILDQRIISTRYILQLFLLIVVAPGARDGILVQYRLVMIIRAGQLSQRLPMQIRRPTLIMPIILML